MKKVLQAAFVVGMIAVALHLPVSSKAFGVYQSGTLGYDVSYPNCNSTLPTDGDFAVLGVTGGRAFTNNSCLGLQFTLFPTGTQSLYLNLNAAVGSTALYAQQGPKTCKKNDKACLNYNYGWQTALNAFNYANTQGATSSMWWFDIETQNSWTSSATVNQQVIQGAQDYFTTKSVTTGIYSTAYMWQTITGGWQNNMPVWVATGTTDSASALSYCTKSFTGGQVYLTQYTSGGLDHDYACQ